MATVITADKSVSDGVAYKMLTNLTTDIPILLLSRVEELNFNEELLKLEGKKYVIIDYIEMGWDVELNETFILGKNLYKFYHIFRGEGWLKLNEFIYNNPPVLYFKRELLLKDKTAAIIPIEYVNWQEKYPIQTKEEFDNRPISVLNYWGRSHEARLLFHGEVWKNAAQKGYTVCDNLYYFNSFMNHERNENKWVSLNIEHYSRIDIKEILKINGLSKLSVSLPGGGIKCFRQNESPVNSIMVMPEDELAWSYKWEDGINCIKFSNNGDVTGLKKEWDITGTIESSLKRDDLYLIYLNSLAAADFYRVDNYVQYLDKKIADAII